jgi:hypothetical protein
MTVLLQCIEISVVDIEMPAGLNLIKFLFRSVNKLAFRHTKLTSNALKGFLHTKKKIVFFSLF